MNKRSCSNKTGLNTGLHRLEIVVLYRVPDPKGGGPHVKQNPRKGVLNFLEEHHPRIL